MNVYFLEAVNLISFLSSFSFFFRLFIYHTFRINLEIRARQRRNSEMYFYISIERVECIEFHSVQICLIDKNKTNNIHKNSEEIYREFAWVRLPADCV